MPDNTYPERESVHQHIQCIPANQWIGSIQVAEENRLIEFQQQAINAWLMLLAVESVENAAHGRCHGGCGCQDGSLHQVLDAAVLEFEKACTCRCCPSTVQNITIRIQHCIIISVSLNIGFTALFIIARVEFTSSH